jgi:oligopeptide/dipeptide ABC transporter ATP-binding protein
VTSVPPPATPLLRATGLRKEFPRRGSSLGRRRRGPPVTAVDDVSFEIRPGETLGLVGESGSGKSTTGRLVLRLLDPTSGAVEFDGVDITHVTGERLRALRRDFQPVFQDVSGSLSQHYAGRYTYELSGGQRQRVGIARALATSPRLVVLDEPVSALDVSTQSQVVNLLADLQQQTGVAYLFIAHDLYVVHHVSHRIAVMYLGAIAEMGAAEQVYGAPRHPYTQALLSSIQSPDPGLRRERIVLHGDIPSPTAIPTGCRFHTRCPYAFEPCATVVPVPLVLADGGTVACHLHTDGPVLAGASVNQLGLGGREDGRPPA